jgi:hypothetical protein
MNNETGNNETALQDQTVPATMLLPILSKLALPM